MSRPCRVLGTYQCEITQIYKPGVHNGIDIVGPGYTLDYERAHSDGTVIATRNDCPGWEDNGSYGNYVLIDHGNGYQTLYAHIAPGTVTVSPGQRVSRGQIIGYMGNTGHSFGGHLHFEVRKNGSKIDPTPYLEADLPTEPAPTPTPTGHNVGDVVNINGVYVSSDSDNRLAPAVTRGTITKIIPGAKNPYLLDNGNIGWVNDSCIVGGETPVRELQEGDTVIITGFGNGSSYGDSVRAGGIGWERTILKIWRGRQFPYQVGDSTGTTGFYKADALKRK